MRYVIDIVRQVRKVYFVGSTCLYSTIKFLTIIKKKIKLNF